MMDIDRPLFDRHNFDGRNSECVAGKNFGHVIFKGKPVEGGIWSQILNSEKLLQWQNSS